MLIKIAKKRLTESKKDSKVLLKEDFFSWKKRIYDIVSQALQIKTEEDLQSFFDKYPYLRDQYITNRDYRRSHGFDETPQMTGRLIASDLEMDVEDRVREMNEDIDTEWTESMLEQRKTVKMTESIIKKNLHARKLFEDEGESAKLEADDWFTTEIQDIVSKAIAHSIAVMSRYPDDYAGLESTFQGKKDQLLTDAYIVWVEKVLPKELTWAEQGLVYSIIEKNIRKPYWNEAQKSRKDTSEAQTGGSDEESYSLFDKIGASEDSEKIRIELDSYGLGPEERKLAILKAYFQGGVMPVSHNEMTEVIKSLADPSYLDKEGKVTNNDIAKAMGYKSQTDIKFYRLWNAVKDAMSQ